MAVAPHGRSGWWQTLVPVNRPFTPARYGQLSKAQKYAPGTPLCVAPDLRNARRRSGAPGTQSHS